MVLGETVTTKHEVVVSGCGRVRQRSPSPSWGTLLSFCITPVGLLSFYLILLSTLRSDPSSEVDYLLPGNSSGNTESQSASRSLLSLSVLAFSGRPLFSTTSGSRSGNPFTDRLSLSDFLH